MKVSTKQGYKPPVKPTGRGKKIFTFCFFEVL